MFPHHIQTIQNVTDYFQRDPDVLAVLLSGSIAHGFETARSDVDIMIFIPEESHREHVRRAQVTFFNRELATYEGGYVDGKYLSPSFVQQVLERGSEPARFAFEGARVLFNQIPDFEEKIGRVAEYPLAGKAERIRRFYAQFEAWHWYCGEALKQANPYLLGTSVSRLVLFGGRLLLAHNEMLYPYHKWFLSVLEKAQDKPADLLACIRALTGSPTIEHIERFYEKVQTFQMWSENHHDWPVQFMLDSEWNWMDGKTPVDDL